MIRSLIAGVRRICDQFTSIDVHGDLFYHVQFFRLVLPGPLRVGHVRRVGAHHLQGLVRSFKSTVVHFPNAPTICGIQDLKENGVRLLRLHIVRLFICTCGIIVGARPFLCPSKVNGSRLYNVIRVRRHLRRLLVVIIRFFRQVTQGTRSVYRLE